ncbi:MAG: 4Fe-4S binding protein [Desulfobacteraceae bacterium]|nr:MAG: 4Fe-4S binding protein [Desulfobacteraceae bacterium]
MLRPSMPGCSTRLKGKTFAHMKTRQPKYALVLWYSQTGHTQRIGRLIGRNGKRHGLKVDAKEGKPFAIDWEVSFEDILKHLPVAWSPKLLMGKHTIEKERCIGCGTCVNKCPLGAIDLDLYQVDTGRCIACRRCINNCPSQAVDREYNRELCSN